MLPCVSWPHAASSTTWPHVCLPTCLHGHMFTCPHVPRMCAVCGRMLQVQQRGRMSTVHMFTCLHACICPTCMPHVAAGCKSNDVTIVYTPWANLKKTASMDVGQVQGSTTCSCCCCCCFCLDQWANTVQVCNAAQPACGPVLQQRLATTTDTMYMSTTAQHAV